MMSKLNLVCKISGGAPLRTLWDVALGVTAAHSVKQPVLITRVALASNHKCQKTKL